MNKPNKTELEYFIRYSLDSDKYKRYMELYEEIERLNNNWTELRKWIVNNKHNENTEERYLVVDYGTLLGKMRELEGIELTKNDKKQVKWLKEEFKVGDDKE